MLAPGGAPWVQQKPQQQLQQFQQQQFQQQQLLQQQLQQQQLQQQQQQQYQLQQALQQQQAALQHQAAAVPTRESLAAAYETVLQAHKAAAVDPQFLEYYNTATQVYNAMLSAASAAAQQQPAVQPQQHQPAVQPQQQQQPAVQPATSNPLAAAAASAAAAVVKHSAEPGAAAAARVAAPAPVPAPAPQAQAQEYPPALKAWAERQLDSGKALGVEREVTSGLFSIVRAASEHGQLWARNWDAEPDVPALAAAAAAAASASAAASGAWGAGGRDARAEKRYRASDGLGASGASASSPARQTWSAPDEEEGGGFSEGSGFLAFSGSGGGGRGGGGWQRAGGYFHKNPSHAFREQQQQQYMMQGGPGEQEEGADAMMMWGGRGDRQRKRASREERFGASGASGAGAGSSSSSSSGSGSLVANAILAAQESGQEVDWSQFAVVGTCASLEKRYFRLLAPPDPATVRPEPILAAALDSLQQRYLEGALTYASVCDSLKAVRQDLAVQHIRNAFTVRVYQVHARLALENGDQGEFNQSQGQLELLWREEGSDRSAYVEFAAYRVLYMAWMGQAGEANAVLKKFSPDALRHPWVRHALAAATAQATENWAHFFRLYRCVGLWRCCAGCALCIGALGFLTRHALPIAPLPPPPFAPRLRAGLRPTRAAAS